MYSQNDNTGRGLSNCSNCHVDVHADGAFVVYSLVTACVVDAAKRSVFNRLGLLLFKRSIQTISFPMMKMTFSLACSLVLGGAAVLSVSSCDKYDDKQSVRETPAAKQVDGQWQTPEETDALLADAGVTRVNEDYFKGKLPADPSSVIGGFVLDPSWPHRRGFHLRQGDAPGLYRDGYHPLFGRRYASRQHVLRGERTIRLEEGSEIQEF